LLVCSLNSGLSGIFLLFEKDSLGLESLSLGERKFDFKESLLLFRVQFSLEFLHQNLLLNCTLK